MVDRDHIDFWGVNMRLQPIQAIVASHVLDTLPELVKVRNRNARLLDKGLTELQDFVRVPLRPPGNIEAYQLYLASFKRRDELCDYLVSKGIEVKVHYPVPLHLQKAGALLGYKKGDFPVSERQAEEIMSIPSHQYITPEQINYTLTQIRSFYLRSAQRFGKLPVQLIDKK